MDEEKTDKLVAAVMEQLQSDEDNLNAAVDIAIDFSKQNSIAPEILIELSSNFGSNGTYAPAYVFAKAAANLSEGKTKANACYNAGLASSYMGQNEEAEVQYKKALYLDTNRASTHSDYGNILIKMRRNEEAEVQYKKALSLNPNHVNAHSNYGQLLSEMRRNEEAEVQYKKALDLDPNNADTHYNYGIILNKVGRNEEAEVQYKKALVLDPNNADTHYNYGVILNEMGRNKETEVQYKKALALDPNHVIAHSNYGIHLSETGRNDEAEEQYKRALALDPNYVNAHGAYGFLLFDIGEDKKALAEIKIASRLFREKDDNVMEHLALAWLHERYTERYYKRGNALKDKNKKSGGYFRKSGVYAGLAGDEYIRASKHAGDEGKGLYLSQGYTLKGRSEIRILDFSFRDKIELRMRNLRRYDIAKFERIMNGVENAANYYKESAKHSPKRNIQCDACSNCMSVLSNILDYVKATIHYKTVPELSVKIDEWRDALHSANITFIAQEKSDKGRKFVESLSKFIVCIENLEKCKKIDMPDNKISLNACMDELIKVASNIEGPLQEIIEDSAKRMGNCKIKHKFFTSEGEEENIGEKTLPKKRLAIIKSIIKQPINIIYGIIIAVIVRIIVNKIDTNTLLELVINAIK